MCSARRTARFSSTRAGLRPRQNGDDPANVTKTDQQSASPAEEPDKRHSAWSVGRLPSDRWTTPKAQEHEDRQERQEGSPEEGTREKDRGAERSRASELRPYSRNRSSALGPAGRGPGFAPEHLAREAIARMGPAAMDWAVTMRARYHPRHSGRAGPPRGPWSSSGAAASLSGVGGSSARSSAPRRSATHRPAWCCTSPLRTDSTRPARTGSRSCCGCSESPG
jgi:hypothetical protein